MTEDKVIAKELVDAINHAQVALDHLGDTLSDFELPSYRDVFVEASLESIYSLRNNLNRIRRFRESL